MGFTHLFDSPPLPPENPVVSAVNIAHVHLSNGMTALETALTHLMSDFQHAQAEVQGNHAILQESIARAEELRQAGLHLAGVAEGVQKLLATPSDQTVGAVAQEAQQVVTVAGDAGEEIQESVAPGPDVQKAVLEINADVKDIKGVLLPESLNNG